MRATSPAYPVKLNSVDASFADFVFGNKRLFPVEYPAKLPLSEAGLFPEFSQSRSNDSALRGVYGFKHVPILGTLLLVPKIGTNAKFVHEPDKKFGNRQDTQCEEADVDTIRVGKCRGMRYWAIWVHGELLAVTVYKKGALAIKEAMCTKLAKENFPD
jgi:hypothetical protein